MRPWPAEMGAWTLDAQSMIWAGGQPVNLEVLYGAAPIGWENLEMPGVGGKLPRDPWVTEAEYEIEYDLDGLVLSDGSPASTTMAGFHSNYTKLRTLVGTPSTWTGSGRTSVITPQGGAARTAVVQAFVSPWNTTARKAGGLVMPVTVTVVVPSGAHA